MTESPGTARPCRELVSEVRNELWTAAFVSTWTRIAHKNMNLNIYSPSIKLPSSDDMINQKPYYSYWNGHCGETVFSTSSASFDRRYKVLRYILLTPSFRQPVRSEHYIMHQMQIVHLCVCVCARANLDPRVWCVKSCRAICHRYRAAKRGICLNRLQKARGIMKKTNLHLEDDIEPSFPWWPGAL